MFTRSVLVGYAEEYVEVDVGIVQIYLACELVLVFRVFEQSSRFREIQRDP